MFLVSGWISQEIGQWVAKSMVMGGLFHNPAIMYTSPLAAAFLVLVLEIEPGNRPSLTKSTRTIDHLYTRCAVSPLDLPIQAGNVGI